MYCSVQQVLNTILSQHFQAISGGRWIRAALLPLYRNRNSGHISDKSTDKHLYHYQYRYEYQYNLISCVYIYIN